MAKIANTGEVLQILKKEYPGAKYYLNFSNPVELMVATILSAQCRDTLVNSVTEKLFKKYRTVADYTNLKAEDVKSITFFNNKAKNIRAAAQIVIDKFGGMVPATMEDLVTLPGVGRKTANAILINAFGKVVGVVVDTHVIRVAYRLGFTGNTNPEKIERDLMALLPKEEWKRFTWLMKDHGRAVCRAPVPTCSKCVLNRICPKNGVTKQL